MREDKEFRIRLEEYSMKDFEKIMLTSGECHPYTYGFYKRRQWKIGSYNCSGFAPLNSYRIERTEDALYILENVC